MLPSVFAHMSPSTRLPMALSHSIDPPQQVQSWSAKEAKTSSSSGSDATDESSSSDKENTPSHSTQKSNRAAGASPITTHVLVLSPTRQQMSFTPRRVKPPPRAWERRPATPFVPRAEGQKIWKRMPLGELGVDVNRQLSRRDKEEKANYVRVVKRMKIDGKEAGSPESTSTQKFLGTKWEEESIERGGSPKKKTSTPAVHKTKAQNDGYSAISRLSEHVDGMASDQERNAMCGNTVEQGVLEPAHADTHITHDEKELCEVKASDTVSDAVSTPTRMEVPLQDFPFTQYDGVLDAETETAGLIEEAMVETSLPEPSVSDADSSQHIPVQTLGCSVSALDGRSPASATMDASRNELSNSGSAATAFSICDSGESVSTAVPPSVSANDVYVSSDHDDTAFLRDFLSRAQASKAAKVMSSPEKRSTTTHSSAAVEQSEMSIQVQNETEMLEEIEDDDLSPPVEAPQTELDIGLKSSSPTRRSTRTSNRATRTRLPRFQPSGIPPAPHFGPVLPSQNTSIPLPNTIQLKRATGCEFIFNAKEQQTIAMMTRANTKKNQGGAIHVGQRLAQLKKELEVIQQPEGDSERNASLDVEVDENDHSEDNKSTSKKRKRSKQGDSKALRVKRNVRWPNEDMLVRYREPTPSEEACDAVEESPSSAAMSADDVQPENLPASVIEPVCSDVSGSPDTKARSKHMTEDASKLKVRRIRKIKLDSVNGTPAPKTRSRSMLGSESDEVPDDYVDASAKSSALSTTRRSSRMPVPVATPIPLPSFTSATKPSSRNVDKEKATEITKDKASANTKTDTKSSEQNLDGRRRLRAKRS